MNILSKLQKILSVPTPDGGKIAMLYELIREIRTEDLKRLKFDEGIEYEGEEIHQEIEKVNDDIQKGIGICSIV